MRVLRFLGYTFGPMYSPRTGGRYNGARPSKKAIASIKAAIRQGLRHGNQAPWAEVVRRLNRTVRGWAAYFCYGSWRRRGTMCSDDRLRLLQPLGQPSVVALQLRHPARQGRGGHHGGPTLLGAQGGQAPLLPLPSPGRQVRGVHALPPQQPPHLARARAALGVPEDLQLVLGGEPSAGRPLSHLGVGKFRRRQDRTVAALLLTLVALGTSGAALLADRPGPPWMLRLLRDRHDRTPSSALLQ